MLEFFIEGLKLYYNIILILVGIFGSLWIYVEYDTICRNKLKLIFMYQYAVYRLAEENINLVGLIILEILTTFSVWFLNAIILIIICIYYILSTLRNVFCFLFKKRAKRNSVKYNTTVLKSCPFCEGRAVIKDVMSGQAYLVQCMTCHASTDVKASKKDAIVAWNVRMI